MNDVANLCLVACWMYGGILILARDSDPPARVLGGVIASLVAVVFALKAAF